MYLPSFETTCALCEYTWLSCLCVFFSKPAYGSIQMNAINCFIMYIFLTISVLFFSDCVGSQQGIQGPTQRIVENDIWF